MAKPPFDLYIGDPSNLQGYRVKGPVRRDSAPLVSGRFSTGRQSQSELDLLKVESVLNLSGGQFQRQHIEPTKVARAVGVFNRHDENIYPTVPRSAALSPAPFGNILAKAENSQYVFASFSYVSGGSTTNYLYYMNAGANNFTQITLPAAFQGVETSVGHIVGLAIHRGYVYIGNQHPNGEMLSYRYDIAAGTFQNIGGISSLWGVLRGVLYTINKSGLIYSCSNEFVAGPISYTTLDTIGNASQPYDMQEYNGALWIAKPEGIFRFDGVKGIKVLDHVTTKLQVFNGALYFVAGSWLYRFDGASVTRLQFFPDTFGGFAASTDFLFIATYQLTNTYPTSDKFGGSYLATDCLRRIYMYDGVGFYMLDEYKVANPTFAYSNLYYTGTRLFDYNVDSGTVSNYRYELDKIFSSTAITTASKLDITTSEFDDGFPSVFKSLEVIDLDYTGLGASDSIAVQYQYYDGSTWSAWQALPSITTATGNKIEITDASKKLFKKLKINATASPAAGSTLAIRSVTWRYTLQPRVRWRWQATLIASGNGATKDRNNTAISDDSNALSSHILKAVKQKTPLVMLAHDYALVKTQINSTAVTFIAKGRPAIYTDPYNDFPLIGVKNSNGVWEVLRVSSVVYDSGADQTTIDVKERGYSGITAATINADAEIRLAYKVYATRLLSDAPHLDDNTYAEQSTGESQLQRELMLEIIEV